MKKSFIISGPDQTARFSHGAAQISEFPENQTYVHTMHFFYVSYIDFIALSFFFLTFLTNYYFSAANATKTTVRIQQGTRFRRT